jgi:hypothetical protein
MFLLGHDGGLPTKGGELVAERILVQRTFLFDTTGQGIPLILLQSAEYRDSKVSTYAFCWKMGSRIFTAASHRL